ncbi:FAD-dependent monooxygenase [Amycolatopsis acidiphila]|uniref:3-(3-hydroxyphenyl)propionate hydroxylase n=1 Tax=Amycolatopsis acidiphila TaxID=715473 RepID=A0A558A0E5_9PSEU|nr:FAD-dependent monooxygenase [Amycolatopsis acidiphila]TVT17735.1 3-(3-hydroxyphenyl)propionate hydroxylase [Amycolatopsis acidiphila]UIJ60936.1 FAD-dependent monooxygenase [Amycolatopsis acidiphila]GHG88341.1 3-(3-hydroxyphenyl)propionate hydroxylase [Amycolatopsis acidiphila]
MNVLIAGAGPTGLTLAIELARRDVEVRIVDKSTEYFAGSRGDGIQPRTLEVFDDLGVLDAVLAAGGPPVPMRVHLRGEFVQERRMAPPREPTPAVPYPNPWMLGQSQTEGILRDRLAEFGVHVELATEVVSFEQDADGVSTTLSTGEVVRSSYLVGADGGRSVVRKTLGIAFEGTTDESIRMLLGDVAADLDPAYGYWFANELDPRSGVMLSPLPGTDLFQFGAPLTEDDSSAALGTLQAKLDERSAGVRLTRLAWSTVWRPNVRLAERFRAGRVFLAGDAAHVHPPTGGQGLNTGVQDAYNLGWKLADGSPELLDSYEAERREVAARVLGVSTGIMRKYAEGADDAHERGENTLQLDISYRTSTGKLVAGDRAPDAPVVDANGKALRLFDLFRGPHATRLVFGADAPDEPHAYAVLRSGQTASDTYVVDEQGHAFAAYDAADGVSVLVRPDGYVSSRAEPR